MKEPITIATPVTMRLSVAVNPATPITMNKLAATMVKIFMLLIPMFPLILLIKSIINCLIEKIYHRTFVSIYFIKRRGGKEGMTRAFFVVCKVGRHTHRVSLREMSAC